jgi:hypothetical protein
MDPHTLIAYRNGMTMAGSTDHITIHDRTQPLWRSILKSGAAFAAQVGVIGVGVIVDSAAMQWAGFAVLGLFIIVLAANKDLLTPRQAADHIFEKYGVTAKKRRKAP